MMKKLQKMKEKKGFTLVELIVVIAILGILAAILIPNFTSTIATAREKATLASADSVRSAIMVYVADNEGDYPTAAANLNSYFTVPSTATLTVTVDGDGDYTGFTYADDGYTATYVAATETMTVAEN